MGVRVHLEKSTTAILGEERVTGSSSGWLRSPVRHGGDLGGNPAERGLARAAGLRSSAASSSATTSPPRGPGVYAVGECAQHRGRVYGLVAPSGSRRRSWPSA